MKKLKKIFSLILLFFLLYSCNKNKEKKINKEYKDIVVEIKRSFKNKDSQQTKYFLKEYLKKSIKENNLLFKGKAYNRLGSYYVKLKEVDSAYYFYNKSVQIFKKIGDSLRLGKSLSNIAIIESGFEDYNKSDSTAIQALKMFKTNGLQYFSSIYNCLGINSRKKRKNERAIKFYEKAIYYTDNVKKTITYKNNLANIYKELKDYSTAEEILTGLLKDTILKNTLITKAKVIDNLAHTKWLEDSTQKILPDLLEAKYIRKQEKDFLGLIASYHHLSDYYKTSKKDSFLYYAYEMYTVSKKERRPNDVIKAIDKIINREQPNLAIQLAKERIHIQDSLKKAREISQNKYALIKYESEENEKKSIENELLFEKQKAQKTKIIFISILGFLLFVAFLIYKDQQNKKDKVIEVYKTETRLAKKIHDELANGVYLVMNKAQDKTVNNLALLPDLKKIYALTRDISHEISVVYTGEEFENSLKQLFTDFNKDNCKVLVKGLSHIQVGNLAKEKQIVMYRALQELLVNMNKHSKATLVVINFSEVKGEIFITYKDNGVGVSELKSKNGLQNMDTRIKSINGLFSFESEEGKGFKATIQFKK